MDEEIEVEPDLPLIPLEIDMVVDDNPIVFTNEEEPTTGSPEDKDVEYYLNAHQIDVPIMPPVEVDMIIDDNPIVFNKEEPVSEEPIPNTTKSPKVDYRNEILSSGLFDTDVEYFQRAYKNLDEVKFIRIHCSACDKHMGSAPNELSNRFQHPILKVLLCAKCFQFYCSGEFEKGEDGSELYCRWCGEGGLVYCCTKCPFVFCKNCITRNLGRGMSRIIQNTENWICFSCKPWQISRHRATYWAIQKYSEEMIAKSKIIGEIDSLSEDSNICCAAVKKRSEVYDKLKTSLPKKPKIIKLPSDSATLLQTALLQSTPSTSKAKPSFQIPKNWQANPYVSTEPLDEVICTPDIIPIDDSPPGSPVDSTPPPLIPYIMQQQQSTPRLPLTVVRPAAPAQHFNISNLQRHLQSSFQQKIILTPTSKLLQKTPTPLLIRTSSPTPSNIITKNKETKKYVVINNSNSAPKITTIPIVKTPTLPPSITKIKITEPAKENSPKDWFDTAVIDCAEVTEYISTKIASLSGVHSRAYKSPRLMEELHNTLQTYVHVAVDKLFKIKRTMQQNFDKEMEKKKESCINPYANKTKVINSMTEDSNSSMDSISYSNADSNSNNSYKKPKKKNKIVLTKNIQPDDVLFDMDVTNASDEELESVGTNSSRAASRSDLEGPPKNCNEVIDILSSDESDLDDYIKIYPEQTKMDSKQTKDDLEESNIDSNKTKDDLERTNNTEKTKVDLEETNVHLEKTKENNDKMKIETTNIHELVANIQSKFNIKHLPAEEVLTCLSSKVVLSDNRESRKKFKKISIKETDQKDFNVVEYIQELLNSNAEQETEIDGDAEDTTEFSYDNHKEATFMEENYDVEEMLGSTVVLRQNKSFGDEFSKFIDKSENNESQIDSDENMSVTDDEETLGNTDEDDLLNNDDNLHEKSSENHDDNLILDSTDEDMLKMDSTDDDKLKMDSTDEDKLKMDSTDEDKLKMDSTDEDKLKMDSTDEEKLKMDSIDDDKLKMDSTDEDNLKLNSTDEDNLKLNSTDEEKFNNDDEKSSNNIEFATDFENELDVDLCLNKDNESLSLPPDDGVGDNLATKCDSFINNKNNENGDLVLDSGILALKQMAENCVNSPVEMRQASAECNG